MKKKLRSFVILTALSTATIHIINRGIHYFATMHNLLQRDDTDDYEWRFGRVHYRKCGEGKPLLLLHDLAPASSSVEWSYTISLLAKKSYRLCNRSSGMWTVRQTKSDIYEFFICTDDIRLYQKCCA